MMKLLAAVLLAGAVAKPAADAAVIAAVKAELKDADSAKFKGVKQTSPGYWCGWVNAKNGYGGYAGFAVFYYHDGKVSILPTELSEPKLC
jgi:hypothetical protein